MTTRGGPAAQRCAALRRDPGVADDRAPPRSCPCRRRPRAPHHDLGSTLIRYPAAARIRSKVSNVGETGRARRPTASAARLPARSARSVIDRPASRRASRRTFGAMTRSVSDQIRKAVRSLRRRPTDDHFGSQPQRRTRRFETGAGRGAAGSIAPARRSLVVDRRYVGARKRWLWHPGVAGGAGSWLRGRSRVGVCG